MTVLLAIETSQREGGVALYDGAEGIEVEPLRASRRHDDDLLAAIERLVRRRGLEPCDVEAVAVSVGPGGFTGLRIAVSTVKMLAEALGCVLVAVPSALVVAAGHALEQPHDRGPLLIALATKRETFWASLVRIDEDRPRLVGIPGLVGPPELPLDGVSAMVADRYLPDWAGRAAVAARVPRRTPRFDPAAVARIGLAMWREGRVTDPLALQPIYPRPPEATRLWRREG